MKAAICLVRAGVAFLVGPIGGKPPGADVGHEEKIAQAAILREFAEGVQGVQSAGTSFVKARPSVMTVKA